MTDFKERLRKLRLHYDLKQDEMAQKIGINRATLNKWERGASRPQYEELVKLIDTFHEISPQWILLGEGKMISLNNNEELKNEEIRNLIESMKGTIEAQKKYIKLLEDNNKNLLDDNPKT